MTLQHDILLELVEEYKQTKSSVVLEKIIRKLDKLLLHTIHDYTKFMVHLKKVEFRDLYHTAILSIPKVIENKSQSTKPFEIRVIRQIEADLRHDFCRPIMHRNAELNKLFRYTPEARLVQELEDNKEFENYKEQVLIDIAFDTMVNTGVITQQEKEIFYFVVYKHLTPKQVCVKLDLTKGFYWWTWPRLLEKIKKWFVSRGNFTDE